MYAKKIITPTMDKKKVEAWMRLQLQLGEHIDGLEVNCTELAEAACQEFDLYGPPPRYDAPEELFDLAIEISDWWQEA